MDDRDGARPQAGPGAQGTAIDRRDFLRRAGIGAGTLVAGGGSALLTASPARAASRPVPRRQQDVVVVGAGVFGVWTAYHLQQMGANVTLVDLYGPGNSRSTSGDETRGIRTAYGDNTQWSDWASRSIARWKEFDAEFAREMGGPVYFETGDLILRPEWDPFLEQTRATWDGLGTEYEVLDRNEIARRWPVFGLDGLEVALYEPVAGVGRSRAAVQRVAAIVRNRGAGLRIGRAEPGASAGGRLSTVTVDGSESLGGELFVFALGPWFSKSLPEVMADRIRIPMGNVMYFGTPPGDHRFAFPNLPSWGVAGATGWPDLPLDQRGFRVRSGGQAGDDPDTSTRWVPPEGLEQPRRILTERFPAMANAPLLETRACHYEFSDSRDWIIDRHPDYENVWVAGGGNAEGFKFGPMIGELIAGRVLGSDRYPELTESFRLLPQDP